MSSRGPLEWETCRDYVVPALLDAGWSEDQIVEQYRITDGRIVPTRGRHRRDEPLKADYVLEIAPGFAVAIVEAKREYRNAADGLGQAIRYATLLDVPLAYSTNGLGIVERDFDAGTEDETTSFPTPSHAWLRFRRWKGFGAESDVFGDAIWKLQGDARTSREIYFGLYQALADGGDLPGLYRDFAPDFFDLVVVDECHRGSANEQSSWRSILEYFDAAVQLGMTATPRRTDNIDTYSYFRRARLHLLARPRHPGRLPRAVPGAPHRAQSGCAWLGSEARAGRPLRPRDSTRSLYDTRVRACGLAAREDRRGSAASDAVPRQHRSDGKDHRLLCRLRARCTDASSARSSQRRSRSPAPGLCRADRLRRG